MKIKASVSINRRTCRGENDVMCIRVTDETSRAAFLEFEMSMEDFAYAITGLSGIKVDAEVRALHVVGKVREQRTESVDCVVPFDKEIAERNILEAAAIFEVDGWQASAYTALNTQGGRKMLDLNTQLYRCRVDLYRYVAAPAEGVDAEAD